MVFGWGLFSWVNAKFYRPAEPTLSQTRRFSFTKPDRAYSYARYRVLADGSLFFGPVATETLEFRANLILWGIIQGRNSSAVIGLEPDSNAHTWVVKVGDYIEDNQIIGIGANFITVKNQTGEGRIYLND
jgi:hypothetical protein